MSPGGVAAERGKVHVGIARIDVHLPGVASLKERRARVRRIQAKLVDMGCSVAEVGAQQQWQRVVIGIAIAASNAAGVDRVLDGVTAAIERDPQAVVLSVIDRVDELDADGS